MRSNVLAAYAMLILLPPGVAAQIGFVEVQGIPNGPASMLVSTQAWTEPRRLELGEDPVLLELPAGKYSVEVQQDGFQGFAEVVTVVPDEVQIVRPSLRPIRTEVRLIHLLPADAPFQIGDERGVTPATVRVPIGDHLVVVDDNPFCVRFRADSTAYLRIRAGVLEEIRGANECAISSMEELLPLEPARPRSMIIPPTNQDLIGTELTIWVFVDDTGHVVPDSTWLDPPTRDGGFNERLIEEAAEWIFAPARHNGRAVAAWFPYRISM